MDKAFLIQLTNSVDCLTHCLRLALTCTCFNVGFNAAVGGCFFAVESVLWPSAGDSSSSVTNTTSVVILSAVIASVISEVGLGSDPAFTVPEYDFRSPSGILLLPLSKIQNSVQLAIALNNKM